MASRNNRATEDILDAQNRDVHDRLASKASYLKSLAFDMESEARDHHKLLSGLDDDFDGTRGFLGGTLNRVKHMIGSGRSNRQLMLYVSLGVVFSLFFLYFVIRKLSSASASSSP
eukprot:snap_masked-scaffold1123_size61443-processed-gene-0.4 protein:Tk01077 transcript:snap_masked-scaffold1123_size61443-processed-gene-0.4-mRNA-1 annotation:"bet1-like protein"